MTSQEQELLTRVARAIYEARSLIEGVDSTWDEVVERAAKPDGYQYAKISYEASIKAARAAIEATDTELVRICGKLLECLHQPPQKAGTNYWHVTRGRHIDFGIIASKLRASLSKGGE